MEFLEIIVRILAGTGLGTLIGLERQWRTRTAGVRTNALVSLGSVLFVIMGAYGFDSAAQDPTRVAAQIVSGIGFLGAGVIMKHGSSISGLNTAATLWACAAVGALCGSGLIDVAAAATVVVIAANVLLRPISKHLDKRRGISGGEINHEIEYRFEVRCLQVHELAVRAIVLKAVHHPELTVKSVGTSDLPEGIVVITAIAHCFSRDDDLIEQALTEVLQTHEVLGVQWTAQDVASVD